MKLNYVIFALIACSLIASCHPAKKLGTLPSAPQSLRFINEFDIPNSLSFNGTTVGGLSGIDYDAASGQYFLICDDRSVTNSARFYTARIQLGEHGIDTVQFTNVTTLLNRDGQPYPARTIDPEAIRYNPRTKSLVWSSEGDRVVTSTRIFLEDPSVTAIDVNGKFKDSFALPSNMHMHVTDSGPRQNGVFEGMTFANDFKDIFINVEEPIYEDGPRAASGDSTALVRFIRFNASTGVPTQQYAYRVEGVAYPANPAGSYKINGIPDILWIGGNRFLVIERSFSTGRTPCTIRVFLADLSNATDVSNVSSLQQRSFTPISKKLLLNMDDLGIYIDNIEGMTLGPRLANGHQSIIFVSDDNFSKEEKMQFLLFEIISSE